MAKLRVGINGFGRIGRLVLRGGIHHPEIDFVGVNDLVPPANLAYLFKYDSTHGKFDGSVVVNDNEMVVNGDSIRCTSIRNPAELPWKELDVDYVVESTGLFATMDGAMNHVHAGAKRVIISAPTKDPDKVSTFVVGVNHDQYDPQKDFVVSNASCTTNCLAPVAKVIQDNFGLAEGLMTNHSFDDCQPTHCRWPQQERLSGGAGRSTKYHSGFDRSCKGSYFGTARA